MFAPPPRHVAEDLDLRPDRLATRITAGLVLGAVIVFTWRCLPTWTSVVDDAYISARYADMLAHGHGLTYSADAAPVEGITNIAWTLLLALTRLVGLPMTDVMTGLGWAFGAASVAIAAPLTRVLSGKATPANALPSWILAVSPHLAVASTNGLESSMMVFAVLLAVWAHLVDDTPSRWRAGAALALVITTRPEGAAVAAGIVCHALWRERRTLRQALPTVGWALGTVGALLALRLAVYGVPLPNTWYAKQSFPLSETWRVNDQYIKPDQATFLGMACLWALGAVLPPWRTARGLVAVLALGLAFIPLNVYMWMPGLRLYMPVLALASVLTASAIASWGARWSAPAALVVFGLAVGLARDAEDRAYDYDGRHSVEPANGTELAATWIRAQLPPGEWLATRDAGVFAYYIGPDTHVAELHQRALTRPHVDGRDADIASYTPPNPAVIVVTQRREKTEGFVYGNDRRVLNRTTEPYRYEGRVYQHYHRYYDVYVRADLPVSPLPPELVVSKAGPPPPHPAP